MIGQFRLRAAFIPEIFNPFSTSQCSCLKHAEEVLAEKEAVKQLQLALSAFNLLQV